MRDIVHLLDAWICVDGDVLSKFKDSQVGRQTRGAFLLEFLLEDVACAMTNSFASHSLNGGVALIASIYTRDIKRVWFDAVVRGEVIGPLVSTLEIASKVETQLRTTHRKVDPFAQVTPSSNPTNDDPFSNTPDARTDCRVT